MGWTIGVDESASVDSKKNLCGFALFKDGELFKVGERRPDPPHYDADREWLRETVVMISSRPEYPYDDVTVALETCYFGQNVEVFKNLVSIKEHLHAATRELGCQYIEITPQESFKTITGRPKNIKGQRKQEMVAAVLEIYGQEVSDHIADAIAIGKAAYNRQQKEHYK